MTIPHQNCSKTATSLFHNFCYQDTKVTPSDQTWLSQNPTKINSFCNQTFDTSYSMHLWEFPTKIAQKPWLHFFTSFASNPKKPIHPTWLSENPTKINSFCKKNFWDLILDAFVTIRHQDCSKTMTSLFHQFCYEGIKTRPSDQSWLSQNPTRINSFWNQTFDTSFWMHLWQFPTKIARKPTLHFFTKFATKAQKLGQATKHG